ncbi:MAG: FmdB family transcriptional regulator [Actinomycetia bacterium]|nr:FmdB family transcriptional regulator [Actinomycetes bacterium]
MPTYQYVCTECGGQLEAVQKFSDDPLTMHDDCGGKLRKVFSPVGIVFKGSGFYRTDSRSGAGAPAPAASAASSSSDSGASSSSSTDSGASSSAPAASDKSSSSSSSSSSSEGSAAKKSSEKVA